MDEESVDQKKEDQKEPKAPVEAKKVDENTFNVSCVSLSVGV